MNPFRVGDKVRCIDEGNGYFLNYGQVYAVTDAPDEPLVSLEGVKGRHHTARFELVTEPKNVVTLDLDAIGQKLRAAGRAGTAEDVIYNLRLGGATPLLIADQIEAQIKPPRIEEPGLWGVVTARSRGMESADPRHFVRTPDGWQEVPGQVTWDWDGLIEPELVRDGVDDEEGS